MHTWTEGPRHILFQLQCLKSQSKEVVDLVRPTIKRSAWYAHSEAILQTLLCSNDQLERKKGVKIIQTIREKKKNDAKLEPFNIRIRKTPDINFNATSIEGLISWSEEVSEPPLTCFLSNLELTNFNKVPMKVPDWPCHSQSVERTVKMVTKASSKYFSHEKRDGGIRTQEATRRLMSRNDSKQDLCKLTEFKF